MHAITYGNQPLQEMNQYLILVDDAEEEEHEESIDRLFECLDTSSSSSGSSGSGKKKKKDKKKHKNKEAHHVNNTSYPHWSIINIIFQRKCRASG